MGSLIRAAAMRGYPELVRELGGDPAALLARFGIPVGRGARRERVHLRSRR